MMKSDPMHEVTTTTIRRPPSRGPGSGKEAWVAYALDRAETCATLWQIVDDQSAVIRDLEAEIRLLREQVAARKPGGRPRLDDRRVAEVERDLAAGYSTRQIASRCAVSAMTVSRIAARMRARG